MFPYSLIRPQVVSGQIAFKTAKYYVMSKAKKVMCYLCEKFGETVGFKASLKNCTTCHTTTKLVTR